MAIIAKPVIIAPIPDGDITENSITIKWTIDTAASKYSVKVLDGTTVLAGYPKDATMPDSFTATGLTAGKEYGFQIQAIDAADAINNSDWSDVVKATTKAAAVTPLTWKIAPSATAIVKVGDIFTFETPVAQGGTTPIAVTYSPTTVDTSAVKTVVVTYTATDSSTPPQTLQGKTTVTVEAKKLPKVANVTVTNVQGDPTGTAGTGTLDWDEISPKPAGVTYWGIYDGGSPWELKSKPYNLTSLAKGAHNIQVQARGDGTNYLNGDPSDVVNFTVPVQKTYSVRLVGKASQTFEATWVDSNGNPTDRHGNPLTSGFFVDEGAEVVDQNGVKDASLTNKLTVTGSVDHHTPSVNIITYTLSATDNPNGKEINVTRTVTIEDTTPPIIELNGAKTIELPKGATFTDPGVTTDDNAAGTVKVTKAPSVDTSVPGSTTITYTATDAAGLKSTVQRTVKILDELTFNVAKTDILIGGTLSTEPNITGLQGTEPYSFTYKPDLSSVVTSKPGRYQIEVTVTDSGKPSRTGKGTWDVEIHTVMPDTNGEDFLDGKAIFVSNYTEKNGDGITDNDDQKIVTAGTEYEKAVQYARSTETPIDILMPNTAAWYDEKALDPYERRIVADETGKPYIK